MKQKKRLIQSIRRASDILNIFSQENSARGITDLAKQLQLPKTTVQGIVQALEGLSYLEKEPNTSKYRLGPKVFLLGMRYATNMDIVTVGRVWMEPLSFKRSLKP